MNDFYNVRDINTLYLDSINLFKELQKNHDDLFWGAFAAYGYNKEWFFEHRDRVRCNKWISDGTEDWYLDDEYMFSIATEEKFDAEVDKYSYVVNTRVFRRELNGRP